MADERVLTVPLRQSWIKQARVRRVPHGMNVIRQFVEKHAKVEDVKLSSGINELMWIRGAKQAPGKIKIAVRVEEGVAFARLPDEKVPVKEGKKEKPAAPTDKPAATPAKEPATPAPAKEAAPKEEKKKPGKELSKEDKEAEQIWKEAEQKSKETQ